MEHQEALMGFMDKVKDQAEQALALGKEGVAQGQAKVSEMQSARTRDGLLRDLGSAYYAQLRSGGSADAVTAAVTAIDAHDAATAAAAPTADS
jgi:hypothetical protein